MGTKLIHDRVRHLIPTVCPMEASREQECRLVARRVTRAAKLGRRSRGPLLSPLQEDNEPNTQDATDRDRRAADHGADANRHRDDHDVQHKFAEGRHDRTVSRRTWTPLRLRTPLHLRLIEAFAPTRILLDWGI